MALPLVIFYFMYLAAVAVFLFFSLIAVYRLVSLSGFDSTSLIISLGYVVVSGLILLLAWSYIAQIDWQQSISIIPQLGIPAETSL